MRGRPKIEPVCRASEDAGDVTAKADGAGHRLGKKRGSGSALCPARSMGGRRKDPGTMGEPVIRLVPKPHLADACDHHQFLDLKKGFDGTLKNRNS